MFFSLIIVPTPIIPFMIFFLFLVAVRHIVQTIITRKIKRNGEKKDVWGTVILAACYIFTLISTVFSLSKGIQSFSTFILGVFIMELFVFLRMNALLKLGSYFSYEIRITNDHKLIKEGIYAIVRHPLHLAFLGEVLGMALIGNTPYGYIAVLVLFLEILKRNEIEDRVLEEKFGEEFRLYKKQVPSMNLWKGYRRYLTGNKID